MARHGGATAVLPIPAGVYGIDRVHSQLGFSVSHLGLSLVRGTFAEFDGELRVGEAIDDVAVTVRAEMASVSSGNAARDEHLHGADWFDVANHPLLTFCSTSVVPDGDGDGYRLAGELTIRGITRPVEMAVAYNGTAPFPLDGSTHFGFSAGGRISRSAFGVSYGVPLVSDDVDLWLETQFVRPDGA
jgi:polyisoprenoid-binding protein YceI